MDSPALDFCLTQIEIQKPGWKTLVCSASRNVPIAGDRLWDAWRDLSDWASWSPLHKGARWTKGSDWESGAEFEQVLNLGFPLGSTTSREWVKVVVPGESASWSKTEKGVRSCHLWRFESLPGGETRVTNIEVFDGVTMGLIKPFVAGRWNRLFAAGVDGLVAKASGVNDEEKPRG